VDLVRLRHVLEPIILGLKDSHTAKNLPAVCEQLGLPDFPSDGEGSKRDRLEAVFNAVADAALPGIAERYLDHFTPATALRQAIEDLLWADDAGPTIPKNVRREIARALRTEDLYLDASRFDALLERLFVLGDQSAPLFASAFGFPDESLRAEIQQHVHRNPQDWTPEHLFDRLGAYECTDRRFRLFVEGLASANVRPDERDQRRFADVVNVKLRESGSELRETDADGGYPVFTVLPLTNVGAGRPKNLIFASSIKPDLRFRDAINNDVEIVTGADKLLIYDRAIGSGGLPWRDLQVWWAELAGIANDDNAKKSLFLRLRDCLPESPPQRMLFTTFFETFRAAVPVLPALLPEVHLHWDPRTVKQRTSAALPRQRMDYLMLLPFGVRVVIEVDGKQHYADDDGRAAPAKYADMVAADRDLRLAGYELYRFGGAELVGETGKARAAAFFVALFKRYSVRVPG
jgi:hypothetical protein